MVVVDAPSAVRLVFNAAMVALVKSGVAFAFTARVAVPEVRALPFTEAV
jgi:hypothetical protein